MSHFHVCNLKSQYLLIYCTFFTPSTVCRSCVPVYDMSHKVKLSLIGQAIIFFFLCSILKFWPISDQYQTLVSGRAAPYCNQFHCFNKNVLTAISLSCSVHPKAPCLILGTTEMVFFFFFRNCIRDTVSEMMFSHCFHRECVMTHQIAACKKFAKNCLHQTKITALTTIKTLPHADVNTPSPAVDAHRVGFAENRLHIRTKPSLSCHRSVPHNRFLSSKPLPSSLRLSWQNLFPVFLSRKRKHTPTGNTSIHTVTHTEKWHCGETQWWLSFLSGVFSLFSNSWDEDLRRDTAHSNVKFVFHSMSGRSKAQRTGSSCTEITAGG